MLPNVKFIYWLGVYAYSRAHAANDRNEMLAFRQWRAVAEDANKYAGNRNGH